MAQSSVQINIKEIALFLWKCSNVHKSPYQEQRPLCQIIVSVYGISKTQKSQVSPNTIDSGHFKAVNLVFCSQKTASVLLTLLPENILLSGQMFSGLKYQICGDWVNSVKIKLSSDKLIQTATPLRQWQCHRSERHQELNSSGETPSASPKHTTGNTVF